VTPVALLEPVRIGGVEVRRATLHSAGHFSALGLAEGASVRLRRSGDVIPQVGFRLCCCRVWLSGWVVSGWVGSG